MTHFTDDQQCSKPKLLIGNSNVCEVCCDYLNSLLAFDEPLILSNC